MNGEALKKLVSICTPVYNEADCIEELVLRLQRMMDALVTRYDFEVIACENGSGDESYRMLLKVCEQDPRFRIVRLSRNFGTEGGATAALAHARGDAAVIMNSDLQDPVEYIPEMLGRWEEGYQNVYAIVSQRPGESTFRRICAQGYYALIRALSGNAMPAHVSDFRLVDRAVYETYLRMPERYRMMRSMWAWLGFRSLGIETERPARGGGKSTFRFFAMFHSGLRSILAQTRAPLIIIPLFGVGLPILSFVLLAYEIVRAWFYGVPFGGFGTIMAVMLLLFGLLFVFLWMISEYVGLIFEEVRHRPMYIVSETTGFGAAQIPEIATREGKTKAE